MRLQKKFTFVLNEMRGEGYGERITFWDADGPDESVSG